MVYSISKGLVIVRVVNTNGEEIAVGEVDRRDLITGLMNSKVVHIMLEEVVRPQAQDQTQTEKKSHSP